MPAHSKILLQFKTGLEREIARIEGGMDQLKQQIVLLEGDAAEQQAVALSGETGQHLERLRELLVIKRDYKERLSAEVLRLGDRNPGLLQPKFDDQSPK